MVNSNGVSRCAENTLAGFPRSGPPGLLDAPRAIVGKSVAWIDAKNYAYYGNRLTFPGLRRQARKYATAFGLRLSVRWLTAPRRQCQLRPLGSRSFCVN